ncbi:MAG TPA: SIMPL domain-containing protein [Solirubrobacteraceae bacterium]|nr:SIMPL domain-containing protein [Solirubrobacteraceae bacterium]
MPVRRLAVPASLASLTAALLLAPAARAQAPARTISAVASGRTEVNRDVAQNSRAIGRAVAAARDRAIPRAIANAREEAARLAAAAGLRLGALLAVEEPDPTPFYGNASGAYGAEGTFGPGRFCGPRSAPRSAAATRAECCGRPAAFVGASAAGSPARST